MTIQGKIIHVLPLKAGIGKTSGKQWRKQEYVLQTQEKHPKTICFSLWGEAIDKEAITLGEDITAHIDIESREHGGHYFTEVRAWRIDRTSPTQHQGYIPPAHGLPIGMPAAQAAWEAQQRATQPPQNDLPF